MKKNMFNLTLITFALSFLISNEAAYSKRHKLYKGNNSQSALREKNKQAAEAQKLKVEDKKKGTKESDRQTKY